ncbi:MAG TPA: Tex-like N-terminal domain-containing protein, partial [Chitinophagaceae bacterium]|nr:Tex-like N-terminal domain-containing protein [Chitinophagaceae bacterium]
MLEFARSVASKLNLKEAHVSAVLELLNEGATIPFIARYRKDRTGALDEVQIQAIQDEARQQKEFADRKVFIEKTITEQGKMTEALQGKINTATTIAQLEDIYLPYKPKRKTKAQTARENGLEPLALQIMEQGNIDPSAEAKAFVNEDVKSAEEALQGARDIIAEIVNEDAEVRAKMRNLFEREATVSSKIISGKEEEAAKFKDYFDFSEPATKIPSHRVLAVMRGFMEGFLRLGFSPAEEDALAILEKQFVKANYEAG